MSDPDPIGQALLRSAPPAPPMPPTGCIACPSCGGWLVEPYYVVEDAAGLLAMSVNALKGALRRHRASLPLPTYRRWGLRRIRLLSASELLTLRALLTSNFFRRVCGNVPPLQQDRAGDS